MAIKLTLEEMMFDAWTHMLYIAVPTVRVRTEPALRLVRATRELLSAPDSACSL